MRNLSRTMIGLLLGTAIMIPAVAQAQQQEQRRDRGDRSERGGDRGGGNWARGGAQRETAGGDPAGREAIARGREAARDVERPAPVMQQPVAQPQTQPSNDSRRQWQGGNRDANRGDDGRRDVARGRDNDGRQGGWNRGDGDNRQRDATRGNDDRQRDAARGNDGNQRWSNDRRDWNRDGRIDNRDRDGRSWDRSWTSDRNRWTNRDDGRWDRNWRNDRRYSWQDYRNSNRQIYRLPRYNPPRWGYSYRRWSPGFRWDSWYYSSNYWIADPWYYRLPPADGGYRWVRYYNDAVLVDIRSGEIVDIIYSFFF